MLEKCPNTVFFVVPIFLYLDWIQENTDQKKLRIGHFSLSDWLEMNNEWINSFHVIGFFLKRNDASSVVLV